MTATSEPTPCPICGDYLTMNELFDDCRCVDPAHWLAAGLLAQNDFYHMAQLVASQRSSQTQVIEPVPVGGGLWLHHFLDIFYK